MSAAFFSGLSAVEVVVAMEAVKSFRAEQQIGELTTKFFAVPRANGQRSIEKIAAFVAIELGVGIAGFAAIEKRVKAYVAANQVESDETNRLKFLVNRGRGDNGGVRINPLWLADQRAAAEALESDEQA